jgi:hypothetical protein
LDFGIIQIQETQTIGGEKMPCGRKKVLRYRAVDVGRPGHHYLRLAVMAGKGVRGGRTVGTLFLYPKRKKR